MLTANNTTPQAKEGKKMHDRIMDVLKPLIALHLGRRTGVQRAAGLREFVGFLRQVITELETEASQIERGVCFTKEQVRP